MNTQNADALAATISGADFIAAKLFKTKSRIEASEIVSILDDNGRVIDVFYRVLDACPNAQTDLSEDRYCIEQVTYKGRKVNYSGRGEQIILDWLYLNNPANVKY